MQYNIDFCTICILIRYNFNNVDILGFLQKACHLIQVTFLCKFFGNFKSKPNCIVCIDYELKFIKRSLPLANFLQSPPSQVLVRIDSVFRLNLMVR